MVPQCYGSGVASLCGHEEGQQVCEEEEGTLRKKSGGGDDDICKLLSCPQTYAVPVRPSDHTAVDLDLFDTNQKSCHHNFEKRI